jgi:hypothetical protein
MKHNLIHILVLIFYSTWVWGQNPVETQVDTTNIKIGDAFSLTIKTHTNQNSKVLFPDSPQLGDFEVIDSYPVDTLLKSDYMELIKKYDLTQFNAGSYSVPQLPVIVDAKMFKTDSIYIQVTDIEVDTLKTPLYEIKGISTADASFSSKWFYLIFIILAVLVGFGLYFIIKKRQDANLTEEDKYKTPYEKAVKKLKKLEEKKNWTRGDAKPYYSDMTDIARTFIEDTFDISARELTTFEIISILKNTLKDKKIKLRPEIIREFKRVLDTADLVKFAKSQPTEGEITADTSKIQNIVDEINIAYPISAATQTERIRLREERKRKRKRLRIWVPISVSASLILISGIAYLINISAERDWHLLTFNSTKKLMNKEWITSTYGSNPGITVSTPEVLFRKNDKTIQESALEGVASIQQFKYASINDPLYIILNIVETNREFKYTDKEITDHSIRILTQNFRAKDIDFETSDFENANGIRGVKVKGNFVFSNPVNQKEEKIVFEGVMTKSGINRDQAWVFYLESDTTAPQLAERVFDSMQYKKEEKP